MWGRGSARRQAVNGDYLIAGKTIDRLSRTSRRTDVEKEIKAKVISRTRIEDIARSRGAKFVSEGLVLAYARARREICSPGPAELLSSALVLARGCLPRSGASNSVPVVRLLPEPLCAPFQRRSAVSRTFDAGPLVLLL